MKKVINYLVSLLLGVIITFSTLGSFIEVFNQPRTSFIFSMAATSIIMSVISLGIYRGKVRISKPIILCFCFLVFYLIDFN